MSDPNKITTASSAADFEAHTQIVARKIHQSVGSLAASHRQNNYNTRNNSWQPSHPDYPDEEALFLGMSVALDMLFRAAEVIVECEQRVDFMSEEDAESEEYQHALGELFGAKTTYIFLYKGIDPLETKRVEFVYKGFSQRGFYEQLMGGNRANNLPPVNTTFESSPFIFGVQTATLTSQQPISFQASPPPSPSLNRF